jgi:hypothetical protein
MEARYASYSTFCNMLRLCPSGLTLRPPFWAEPWENPKRLPSIERNEGERAMSTSLEGVSLPRRRCREVSRFLFEVAWRATDSAPSGTLREVQDRWRAYSGCCNSAQREELPHRDERPGPARTLR